MLIIINFTPAKLPLHKSDAPRAKICPVFQLVLVEKQFLPEESLSCLNFYCYHSSFRA